MDELSQIPILQKLTPPELDRLRAIAKRTRFRRDTVIFFQGDASDSLHLILSGSVKVYQTSEQGRERILKILGPWEIVGELAMLDGQPRSATVAALDDTETLSISRRDFERLVAERPEILWRVVETLCEKLRHASGEMVEMSFREVPYRLLRVLTQLCDQHGQATAEGCRIVLKLTSAELAGMVGTSREDVGRLLAQFQERGLVRLDRRQIVVPDPKVLARALEYASDWS
jgi:CRP-like cAMP-binding protein